MSQPSFAIVPGDVLVGNIFKFSTGEDLLSLRQAFQLSNSATVKKYKNVLEKLVASYMPDAFVGLFLDMMRHARDSEDKAHRNVFLHMEYSHIMEGYDNGGQLIHPRNDHLYARFLRYFGPSLRSLFAVSHLLLVRYPDIKAMHILWAFWKMKRQSLFSSPHEDHVRF